MTPNNNQANAWYVIPDGVEGIPQSVERGKTHALTSMGCLRRVNLNKPIEAS
jgi:hypothetical protein